MNASTKVIIQKEIKSGFVVNGVLQPNKGYKLFIRRPANIVKAILNPTQRINFSVKGSLSNFKICNINQPGTKVKKINPWICLRIGMLKLTDINSVNKNINTYMRNQRLLG